MFLVADRVTERKMSVLLMRST